MDFNPSILMDNIAIQVSINHMVEQWTVYYYTTNTLLTDKVLEFDCMLRKEHVSIDTTDENITICSILVEYPVDITEVDL